MKQMKKNKKVFFRASEKVKDINEISFRALEKCAFEENSLSAQEALREIREINRNNFKHLRG